MQAVNATQDRLASTPLTLLANVSPAGFALIAVLIVIQSHLVVEQNMRASSFAEYASLPNLTPDEIYTVELLIERVRSGFDADYWENWSERCDAREGANYTPRFLKDHVQPAEKELKELSWLSFQRLRALERPVRDLSALRFLSKLSGLVLIDNEVSDIKPIGNCVNLRRLHLQKNPIRDISPLAECINIEEVELGETSIEDFSVLQTLPKLRKVSLSADQVPAFRRLEKLPSLQKLELRSDTFDSFEGFPQMPELRVIWGADVRSLEGLQRFPKLENLVNLRGEFQTLEPLRESKSLTHVNILSSRIRSLEPLVALFALRELWVNTELAELDLSPLESLPALHEVTVKCAGKDSRSLVKLRASLLPWDIEFRSSVPRRNPSLEIEVVDQKTFDIYNTQKRFNLNDSDSNEGLLSSELEWLDDQIGQVLSVDFTKDEDYTIPFQWGGARSRTVALLSERAVEAFPRLVLGIQEVLAQAKNDWIIYFQSDEAEAEFAVWIYPEKIMVTEEYADKVRKLIKPN